MNHGMQLLLNDIKGTNWLHESTSIGSSGILSLQLWPLNKKFISHPQLVQEQATQGESSHSCNTLNVEN